MNIKIQSLQIISVITTSFFILIYHANFSQPILEEGARLHGTIEKITPFNEGSVAEVKDWSSYGPPAKDLAGEVVNCLYPKADSSGDVHFMLENATGEKGVSFSYPLEQLPYLNQWKNPDSLVNGYVTGLEPATGFAHNRAWERKQGRVPTLEAGAQRSFELEYTILSGDREVTGERERIALVNGGSTPQIISALEEDPRDEADRK